jgi:hypothetical protein
MDQDNKQNSDSQGDQTLPDEKPISVESEKKGAENSSPDIDMEIHHHPQLEHKKKHWKEYILEGLMIFIAVMMGFIAENIREGITNRDHVKELVSQLVQDLKSDTTQLNDIYQGETEIMNANGELTDLLQQPLKELNMTRLQQLIVKSHNLWLFAPSTGAIQAIKSEIHLKQFSSSKMIALISAYEKHIDLVHTVQEITLQYQRMYLDPFLVNHFTAAALHAAFDKKPDSLAQARNLSQEDLTQLASEMVLVQINTKELKDDNRLLWADASNLLGYVKEQFDPAGE